jgi:hypothetical protein
MGKIQVNDPIRPRELTRLCAGETVDVALPEDVDNEGVLPVLGTGLATREEIVGPCFEALQREGGDRARRVPGFVRRDDDDVAGHGPGHRHDVQPGACATLFVFGHNVRDEARVGACDPVPPKLQEDKRRRVERETRAGAERK